MSDEKYDYVVIGAGPAGCVLANRLTGDPGRSVALLEAGQPDKAREIHIPAAFSKLFAGSYDWNYHTAKQPQLADRAVLAARQDAGRLDVDQRDDVGARPPGR